MSHNRILLNFASDSSISDYDKDCSQSQTTQASTNAHMPISFAHMLRSQNIFTHSSLQQNELPFDNFIFMTAYMEQKMHKLGRVCRLYVVSECLDGEKGHDKICLITCLNENLKPTIISVQTFNSLRIKEQKAIISHLEFLKQNKKFVPESIFLHQSLHQAVRKFNCLEYEKIVSYQTFAETSQQIKRMFVLADTHSLLQKFIHAEIDDMIEQNDAKKCENMMNKLKKVNKKNYDELRKEMQKKTLSLSQIAQQYVGLMFSKHYNQEMDRFIIKIARKKMEGIQSLIEVISNNQLYQLRCGKKKSQNDQFIMENDSKLNLIKEKYEERPFEEFMKMYKKSLASKYRKASNFMYIVSLKKGTPYLVQKTQKLFGKNPTFDWKCECLYLEKTGIPCEHLIKVLTIQKLKIDQYMDKIFERSAKI